MVKDENGDMWLTPQEAADRLGITVGRIYHIKDRLTHRKGRARSARLFFLEKALFNDYMGI